jgi:hypothetical protein
MTKLVTAQPPMVPVQMNMEGGAFICNVRGSDLSTIEARERGTFVVVHCAIRLDAMRKGLYELYKTKEIETSSIDFCRPIRSSVLQFSGKPRLKLCK